MLPTILMFLEYGLAIASSTYCLTFFFSDHTMAQVWDGFNLISLLDELKNLIYSLFSQNVVLLVHFFTGLVLMVISFIMGVIPSTTSANSFLKVGNLYSSLNA